MALNAKEQNMHTLCISNIVEMHSCTMCKEEAKHILAAPYDQAY